MPPRGKNGRMGRLAATLLAACLPVAVLASPAATVEASQVTVYRCTDGAGHVTLRDTPCRADSDQEVRSMLRPKDAPPRPAPAAPAPDAAAVAAPSPVSRVVVLRTPQPMYACTTPDGETYTSATPEGNPRWVPLWTLGIPVQAGGNDLAITGGDVRIDAGGISVTPPLRRAPWPANAGTWVRDRCHALPQAEVCARLRDDVRELDRRYFNAQPSERAVLRVEKRGLQARMDADCA